MKVAVFGCLHGMLDAMYTAVEDHESKTGETIDFVIVCGDCQTIRHSDDLRCLSVPDKYKKLGDFHEYYSGKKKIPKLTIFVGGNHEASNYLMTLPYGGWVCDNFYYLGYAGVIRYKGLRIAGISGIYNFHNHKLGRFESMPLDCNSIRSIYHTRMLDIFRLKLLSKNALQNDPIDVFLSHDWPRRIYNHGNKEQLLRFKPAFRKDIQSPQGLGSPMTEPLINLLQPRKWFAAHLHCKFYAKVRHDNQNTTEFLSLNKIENRRNFMDILDLNSTREHDQTDDEIYYDEEWLTILRKTFHLETGEKFSQCPEVNDNEGKLCFPGSDDIKETLELLNKTGGMKIARNFTMVEPVIYNRPDSDEPSIDRERVNFYPNPQTEELYSRLQLEKLKTKHEDKPKKEEELEDIWYSDEPSSKRIKND